MNWKDVVTILVSNKAGVLAFISIKGGGKLNGIVQKGNDKGIKFTQKGKGEKVRFYGYLKWVIFLEGGGGG